MPVMDGLEFTKRFRVWEEEQQCLLEAQGTLYTHIIPTTLTLTHIPTYLLYPHLTRPSPPSFRYLRT